MLEAQPDLVKRLAENAETMHSLLHKMCAGLPVRVSGSSSSPFFHVYLAGSPEADADRTLQEVVDLAMRDGILLTRAKYVADQEVRQISPSIRVAVSAGFTKREVERAASVISFAFRRALKQPFRFQ